MSNLNQRHLDDFGFVVRRPSFQIQEIKIPSAVEENNDKYFYTENRLIDMSLLKNFNSKKVFLWEYFTSNMYHKVLFQNKDISYQSDYWSNDFVKMPYSSQSLYPSGSNQTVQRWHVVLEALNQLKSKCLKSWENVCYADIGESILAYNGRYTRYWKFDGLKSAISSFPSDFKFGNIIKDVLPNMIDLVIRTPDILSQPIPLLKKQGELAITLSQLQCGCILANAFFCTFPLRNKVNEFSKKYPSINFSTLFSFSDVKVQKLICILNYFARISSSMPTGNITFHRSRLTSSCDWSSCDKVVTNLRVFSEGTIEDSHGDIQIDFANKIIGGGILNKGCVQEEIRFAISPELIVARLFTEELDDDECLHVIGSEMFNSYEGYAKSFKWTGNIFDNTPLDGWKRKMTNVTAIDALSFVRRSTQYEMQTFDRELNKALCGFSNSPYQNNVKEVIATGNWGCGVYGGNKELKAIIQLMACSVTDRELTYYTFYEEDFALALKEIHEIIQDRGYRVMDIYDKVKEYTHLLTQSNSHISLFEFIKRSR